jgi:Flp pilus assembly protein CpaB
MKSKTLLIAGIAAVAAVVGGGLLFSQLSHSGTSSVQAPNAQSPGGAPSLQIEATDLDLGTLKVTEERVKEITLTNTGTSPLQISKVNTSCMCTFAQLVIDGKESP